MSRMAVTAAPKGKGIPKAPHRTEMEQTSNALDRPEGRSAAFSAWLAWLADARPGVIAPAAVVIDVPPPP